MLLGQQPGYNRITSSSLVGRQIFDAGIRIQIPEADVAAGTWSFDQKRGASGGEGRINLVKFWPESTVRKSSSGGC